VRSPAWLTYPPDPRGSRLIARRERPHPGAQLSFTDHDGYRFQAILTDQTDTDIAVLECRHRQHATSRTASATTKTPACRSSRSKRAERAPALPHQRAQDHDQPHPATSDRPPARQTVTRSHPPAPTARSRLPCRRRFQAAGAGLGEVSEPLRPLGGADGYWRSNVIQRDYDLDRRSR
jgi:hypothetical protein